MSFKMLHNQGGVEYLRETYMGDGWITQERVEPGTVRLIHGTLYQAHDISARPRFLPFFPRRYRTLWIALRADALPTPAAVEAAPASTLHVNVEAHGVEKMEADFKRLDERMASILAKELQCAAIAAKHAQRGARRRKAKP